MGYLAGLIFIIVSIVGCCYRSRENRRSLTQKPVVSREERDEILLETIKSYFRFEQEVYSFANRHLLYDRHVCDSLCKIVDESRRIERDSIMAIIAREELNRAPVVRELLRGLANEDRMLFILIMCGLDNAAIAAVLHKSANNIRTKRTNLKKRLNADPNLRCDINSLLGLTNQA